MILSLNELRRILKQDKAFDPFGQTFDFDKFVSALSSFSDSDEKAGDFLKFLVQVDNHYKGLKNYIFETFDEIALPLNELQSLFFQIANRECVRTQSRIMDMMKDGKYPSDTEGSLFINLENPDGNSVHAGTAMEMHVDIVSILLGLSFKWEPGFEQAGKTKPQDEKDLERSFSKLWTCSNIIYNLKKSGYDRVVYDKCLFQWDTEKSIKILYEAPQVEFIRTASYARIASHEMEIYIRIIPFLEKYRKKEQTIQVCTIHNGKISLEIVESEDIEVIANIQSSLLKYHTHLAKVPLDYFEGLTISDLGELFGKIIHLINSVNRNEILESKQNSVRDFPNYIEEAELIEMLSGSSRFPIVAIRKFVQSLYAESAQPYFWAQPFFKRDTKLYIPLFCMYAPNASLYFDNWIAKDNYSDERIIYWFREFIVEERKRLEKGGFYQEWLIPEYKIGSIDVLNNNLLLCFKDKVLLIEIVVFNYPIESEEHEQVLIKIANATVDVTEKPEILRKAYPEIVKDKEIVMTVLTSYPLYSGLMINGVSITDYTLLGNYITAGEFVKAAIHPSEGSLTSKNMASIKYYKDETEFNARLSAFLIEPTPVLMILKNLFLREHPIMPSFYSLQINTEIVDRIDEQQIKSEQSEEVKGLLNYQYFVSPQKGELRNTIDNTINYHLSVLFHKLANTDDPAAKERWELFEPLSKTKTIGLAQLTYYLLKITSDISFSIEPKGESNIADYPVEEALQLVERLVSHIDAPVAFSTFKMPDIFTEEEEKGLISFAVSFFSGMAYRNLTDEDISNMLLALVILSSFKKKHSVSSEFYTACSNFIDLLNFSSYSQKASDFCEEILAIAIKDDENPFAWNILFSCYSQQMKAYEAAVYGSLFFTSILHLKKIPYVHVINGYHNLLKYFRNFGYYEFAATLYRQLSSLKIEDYDEQKISVGYYNILIKNIYQKPQALDEIYEYLDKRMDSIIKYGTHACIPWLSMLYNFIRFQEKGVYKPKHDIHAYIRKLEASANPGIVKGVKEKILGAGDNSKPLFIQTLLHSFETRDSADFGSESNQIVSIANNLIRHSFKVADVEGILLTSLVLCDQSFSYSNHNLADEDNVAKFIKNIDPEFEKRLNNYQWYILSKLSLKEGQILVWVFEFDREFSCIMIDSEKQITPINLSKWDLENLRRWTGTVKTFYFNAGNIGDYNLAAQEIEYKKWLSYFAFTQLPVPPCSELLFCSSTDLYEMPHNLMVSESDFIAAKIPICNVISIERYLEHSNQYLLPTNYTINAWIPAEEGNMTVAWGLGILEPILNAANAMIETKRYPEVPLKGDINIFLAHGIRELGGFKVVRTTEDRESAIINPLRIFGKGKIAILFICNSGSSAEDIYARQMVSFSGELLKEGYEAVVATFWPYDVTMSGIWLQTFLDLFNAGETINQSVFAANRKLATYNEATSQLFYAPQGRFAMHLYGNPNIRVQTT